MTRNVCEQYHAQMGYKAIITSDSDLKNLDATDRHETRRRCLEEKTLEIVGSKLLDASDAGPSHGLNAARSFLQRNQYQTTSIEAGLSTCGHLYGRGGSDVDYLFLSRFAGPSPSPSAIGKTFVSPAYLSRSGFRRCAGHKSMDASLETFNALTDHFWAFDILRKEV